MAVAQNVVPVPIAAQSLRGSALVVPEQPTEPAFAPGSRLRDLGRFRRRVFASAQWPVPEPLVRAKLMIVGGPLLKEMPNW